jgi:hypothetical protein
MVNIIIINYYLARILRHISKEDYTRQQITHTIYKQYKESTHDVSIVTGNKLGRLQQINTTQAMYI